MIDKLDNPDDMKKLIEMYSSVRNKINKMEKEERLNFLNDYLEGKFKEDMAAITSSAIKIYSYLGYSYFDDVMKGIINLIKIYVKLEDFPV